MGGSGGLAHLSLPLFLALRYSALLCSALLCSRIARTISLETHIGTDRSHVDKERPTLRIDTNAEQLGFVPLTSTATSQAVVSSPFTPAIYGRGGGEDLRGSVFEYQAGDAASAALAGYGGEMPTEP